MIGAGNNLTLQNIQLDLSSLNAKVFITTDTLGSSNHSNFLMSSCSINNTNNLFFKTAKSSVCDSIIVSNCTFSNNKEALFKLNEETDNKGYYNAEKIKINNCTFTENKAQILTILRSGKDESTMGPILHFSNNKIVNCFTENNLPLIDINGVQISFLENNNFLNCNATKVLVRYQDAVNAVHIFKKNGLNNSGEIIANKFVQVASQ